jgi:hypothetical protein
MIPDPRVLRRDDHQANLNRTSDAPPETMVDQVPHTWFTPLQYLATPIRGTRSVQSRPALGAGASAQAERPHRACGSAPRVVVGHGEGVRTGPSTPLRKRKMYTPGIVISEHDSS